MQDLPTAPTRNTPHPLRSLLIVVIGGFIWYLFNIKRGSIPAIQASPWFVGLDYPSVLLLALSGSVVQHYITKEWKVTASLFNRSRLFRWGSAAILFLWDIAFPAWGLLVSAGIAFTWFAYAVAIAIELAGSWWAQQAATDAAEDLWKALFYREVTTSTSSDDDNDDEDDGLELLTLTDTRTPALTGSAKK